MKAMKIIPLILSIFLISSFFYGCTADRDKSQTAEIECPWDEKGAKQPSDYTWEEFEALGVQEQMAFQFSFADADEFEDWMNKAQSSEIECPWDEEDAKQPSEYSWEEFEKLDAEVQIKFQNSFDEQKDFEKWMNEAKDTEIESPWEEEGAKQPSDYTKEEYDALSKDEQKAFQESFGKEEKFEEWMDEAVTGSPESEAFKQPTDYTWEEFEALSGEEQIKFQRSFENIEEFEKWMNEAQSVKIEVPWEKKDAKQPSEYTWEEFEALSAGEQIEFQKSFENTDDFDKWLKTNKK